MDKIEVLREKIASNKNMDDAFKKNIVTLTDTLVTVFPDYDFETYDFLSTLRIESDNNMDSYTNYNKDENLLKINIDRCFTDRIDIQHLFLTEMILISTDAYSKSEDFNGFNRGMAEEIATIINPDESMKKLNPLSSTLVAAFSKVVDSSVLLSSYMNNDLSEIAFNLEAMGINTEQYMQFIGYLGLLDNEKYKNVFSDCEKLLIDMYAKKIEYKLDNNLMSKEQLGEAFDDFSSMLITSRSELISLYPHHDFRNVNGLETVQSALQTSIINLENRNKEMEESRSK
ncbi:MAG: hypothetical protein PUJ60_00470 [bacterium]|nr:hypothetical protein [bacterium]MDY4109117.1 hypothetical protein [Bacilli bacterium]